MKRTNKRNTNTPAWKGLCGRENTLTDREKHAAASWELGRGSQEEHKSTLCCLLSHLCLTRTLLWMTTTLRLSALSQVSMALQMLQILSRAGAWWSGQPKSNTWETTQLESQTEAQISPAQRGGRLVYLWIELTDVAALFAEVEELKGNRQIKSGMTQRKVCQAFQYLLCLTVLLLLILVTRNVPHVEIIFTSIIIGQQSECLEDQSYSQWTQRKNIPGSFGHVWSAAWRQPPAGWLHSSALPRCWGRRQKWSSLWCRSGPARSSHPGPVADSCSCRQTGEKRILNWAILHINRSAVGKQSWGLLLGSNRGSGIATSNAACDSHTCSSV